MRFDPQARLTLRLAIDQYEKRKRNEKLVPWVRVRVPNVPGELERDAGGLSKTERAFQRSLYHDQRIVKPRKPGLGDWSLKCEWDGAPLLPGAARYLKVTVFPPSEASRYADKSVPRRDQWRKNPRLQSGGIGSGKERFPG